MLKRKHPVIPIHTSGVTWSPYDTPTAKWAARVGFTAPFVLISIGIRMRNSNKIQNRLIQAAHRVNLSAFYQCLRVLQILFHVLLNLNRSMPRRKYLDLDPRIFILHFNGLSPAIDIVNGCFSLFFLYH